MNVYVSETANSGETESCVAFGMCAAAVTVLPFSSSKYGHACTVFLGQDVGEGRDSWQQSLSGTGPQAIRGHTVRMLRSTKAITDATASLIVKTLDARNCS